MGEGENRQGYMQMKFLLIAKKLIEKRRAIKKTKHRVKRIFRFVKIACALCVCAVVIKKVLK